MRLNFCARSSKVHIQTFNMMMLELWIAVVSQSGYAASLSHTGNYNYKVSFSVFPLRSMYPLGISLSFQIITTIFNILIKSSQNFGLKNKNHNKVSRVKCNLKALSGIKVLHLRTWGYFRTGYCFLPKSDEQLFIAQACKAVRRMAKWKHTFSTWQMQSTAGKE